MNLHDNKIKNDSDNSLFKCKMLSLQWHFWQKTSLLRAKMVCLPVRTEEFDILNDYCSVWSSSASKLLATFGEEMFKCNQKGQNLTINVIRKTKHLSHQFPFTESWFMRKCQEETISRDSEELKVIWWEGGRGWWEK